MKGSFAMALLEALLILTGGLIVLGLTAVGIRGHGLPAVRWVRRGRAPGCRGTRALRRSRALPATAVDIPADERERMLRRFDEVAAKLRADASAAVRAADELTAEALRARGFTVATFEHEEIRLLGLAPALVTQYRSAHAVAVAVELASAADLRSAMLSYYCVLHELLGVRVDHPQVAG